MPDYGVVYRVDNPRVTNHGRLRVAQSDYDVLLTSHEVAFMMAQAYNGIVVPGDVATRMNDRRFKK